MHPKFAERIAELHVARQMLWGQPRANQFTSSLVRDKEDFQQVVDTLCKMMPKPYRRSPTPPKETT